MRAMAGTVAFWIERAWFWLLYCTPLFSIFPGVFGISIVLEILICNALYFIPEVDALIIGDKQVEGLEFMQYWARKDRYAFLVERVGMVMLIVGWFLHDSGWIITSYTLCIPVVFSFPLSNFMYTPWFPFLQEEPETAGRENQTEAMPSTEKHHESIKDRKAQAQCSGESKHDDRSGGSRGNVLETKKPPHESNVNYLPKESTSDLHGIGEPNYVKENSKFDIYKCISEMEASWKRILKPKQEEPKKIQMEAMPLSQQHHESIVKTKSQSHSNAEESKHDDQTCETKQPPHESIGHSINQRTAEVPGNGELKHDEANSEFDRNNCTPLPPSSKEELSKPNYLQPHEITKTEHERTEFSLGTALEITMDMLYYKDVPDEVQSHLKLIKGVEATWERKLKTKQEKLKKARGENEKLKTKLEKLKKAREENKKLKTKQEKLKKAREENEKVREEWEEERRKWAEEKTSLASQLNTAKAETSFYYQIAQSNSYHHNKLKEENNDLTAKLCEAIASSVVYRSLLHSFGASA